MVLAVAFLLAMSGFIIVLLLWSSHQYKLLKLKERMERQLIRKQPRNFSILEALGYRKFLDKIQELFDLAGINYEKENTIFTVLIISTLLFVSGLLLNLGLIAVLLPIVFLALIYFIICKMGTRRLVSMEHELRYSMYDIASSLRVSDSLMTALTEATKKAKQPLKSELARILADVNRGDKEDEALINFSHRTRSQIIASWVDTIIFAKETGKELAATCDRAALKIRDKNKMKDKIRAETTASQSTMVGILAILGLSVLTMFSTGNFGRVFFSKSGRFVLAYVIISFLVSTIWVYKTIEKEVNS